MYWVSAGQQIKCKLLISYPALSTTSIFFTFPLFVPSLFRKRCLSHYSFHVLLALLHLTFFILAGSPPCLMPFPATFEKPFSNLTKKTTIFQCFLANANIPKPSTSQHCF